MTHFCISNRRYYLLVAASIYLIFHYLELSLKWTREAFDFVLNNGFNFLDALHILSFCIVFLTFISYFSFYDLRVLKGLSVSIIFLEIFTQTVPFLLSFPDIAYTVLTLSGIGLYLVWLVLMLRLDQTRFPATKSFKLYAKMWLLALVLTVTFTLLIGWTNFPALFTPHFFFFTLPYFALLRLAGQLRSRTSMEATSA